MLNYTAGGCGRRYLALEADNEALRKRVGELVMSYSNGLKGPQAADLIEATGNGNDSQARLDLASMLSYNAVPVGQAGGIAVDGAAVDLVKTADARITAATKEAVALRSQLSMVTEELTVARHVQSNREEEIMRLQALLEGTRDVERLSLEYRNEANEKTIASLNKQLDHLTVTLDKMDVEGKEKSQLQVALKESLREKEALLAQARAATADYGELRGEVSRLSVCLEDVEHKACEEKALAEAKLGTAVDGAEQLRAALEAAQAKEAAGATELHERLHAAAAAAAAATGEAAAAADARMDATAESAAARERVGAAEAALAAAAEQAAVMCSELEAVRSTEGGLRDKCSQLEEDLQQQNSALLSRQRHAEAAAARLAAMQAGLDAAGAAASQVRARWGDAKSSLG